MDSHDCSFSCHWLWLDIEWTDRCCSETESVTAQICSVIFTYSNDFDDKFLCHFLCLVGNGFEFERWLKGLKYLIHDARHASYLLQIERYSKWFGEDCRYCAFVYNSICWILMNYILCMLKCYLAIMYYIWHCHRSTGSSNGVKVATPRTSWVHWWTVKEWGLVTG